MTPSEFKSWFDGFTEAMSGAPTKAQWERVKSRVAEIDGKPTTHTVYLDRYLPSIRPYYRDYVSWGAGYSASGAFLNCVGNNSGMGKADAVEYDSHKAMLMVGRADAKAMAA